LVGIPLPCDWHERPTNRPIETRVFKSKSEATQLLRCSDFRCLAKAGDCATRPALRSIKRTFELPASALRCAGTDRRGRAHETVHLVDWEHPEKNDFALAEEVTLKGGYQRRPDIVLYINGLALAVIELKRSSVELADGVRQLITIKKRSSTRASSAPCSLCWRAATRRGCATAPPARRSSSLWSGRTKPETCGIRRGTRRRSAARPAAGAALQQDRLLDLIRNFIIYDAGHKKVPRPHQFFGVKAAQERIARRGGGVICTPRAAARASSWCRSPSGYWSTTPTLASS